VGPQRPPPTNFWDPLPTSTQFDQQQPHSAQYQMLGMGCVTRESAMPPPKHRSETSPRPQNGSFLKLWVKYFSVELQWALSQPN